MDKECGCMLCCWDRHFESEGRRKLPWQNALFATEKGIAIFRFQNFDNNNWFHVPMPLECVGLRHFFPQRRRGLKELEEAGIRTIADAAAKKESGLYALKNVDKVAVRKVRKVLQKFGLDLREETQVLPF